MCRQRTWLLHCRRGHPVSARYEIPDVCAREWAFAALDATRPYTVLVVAAVDERDVSASTSDGYRGAFVLDNTFLRDADKAKTSGVASRTSDDDAKPPPPGAMVLAQQRQHCAGVKSSESQRD